MIVTTRVATAIYNLNLVTFNSVLGPGTVASYFGFLFNDYAVTHIWQPPTRPMKRKRPV